MLKIKECTPEDMQNEFMKLSAEEKLFDVVENPNKFLEFLTLTDNKNSKGFFWAPASTKYHGNYLGGLYDHSRAVFLRLKKLTEDNRLAWGRPQSPFIIGMFHDLCKYDQYNAIGEEDGKVLYEYNTNTLIQGHGAKSIILLSQFINLTEEEMLCIRYHMGAYEKEEWSQYDMAIRKFPNVLWTHHADMLASKVDGT